MGLAGLCIAMSAFPPPVTAGSHRYAARKRDRRDTVALRRASAGVGDREAVAAARDLGRQQKAAGRASPDAVDFAEELIRRALERAKHVDHALVLRLQNACARLRLLTDAQRLGLKADDLLEIRAMVEQALGTVS